LKTIRPPIKLPFIDEPALDTGRPDLDKLGQPKDGDIYQVFYVVQDGQAVLVSVGLVPIPFTSCPECHSFHVTQEDVEGRTQYHCHECGKNFIWRSYAEVL
jgi:hypothetical protein